MDYQVLNADHLRSLEAIVTLEMKKGWVPQGGVYSVEKKGWYSTTPILGINANGTGLTEVGRPAVSERVWYQAVVSTD